EDGVANFGWLAAVHPDDRDRAHAGWLEAGGEQAPYISQFRVLRRDGEYRTMVARAVPVRGRARALLGWVGTCVDIEESRRVEQGLWRQSGQFALLTEAAARITAESTLEGALRVTAEQARNVIGAHMAAV